MAAGCGGSSRAAAPVARIAVVASNFPIAQLLEGVGGSRVTVTDLSQGAADDRTVTPTPAQRTQLRTAALVVDVGAGYQPAVEAATATTPLPHRLSLAPALGTAKAPQFWLDPPTMARAASLVAAALSAVDPAGGHQYHQGATDVSDQMSSLQIDVQSALADCPHTLLVVPDNAFARLAGRAGLHLLSVPADASTKAVDAATAQIRNLTLPTIFSEPPVSDAALAAVARTTHVALHPLDTLDGPAPNAKLANASYFERMDDNLHVLAGGLYCSSSGNS